MEKMESPAEEELVHALMEKLVYRHLHCSSTKDQHKCIAKQMHAVVLLYNYYHRKQKQKQLKFLDFESFCDLALTLKQSLAPFITNLSLTWKSILDACDIASALDANTQECHHWPITKVAVLIVDSKNENCKLQFGVITEGVWSLFEKELVESIKQNVSVGGCDNNKRKRADNDDILLATVYEFVKEITGLESKEVVILGTHVVYSLSKKESATKLYLVQLPVSETISPKEQVPLKILVERLQGPLAEKAFGSWSTTEVVSYYHMLPYADFIANWLAGKELCSPSIGVEENALSIISGSSVSDNTIKGSEVHTDSNSAGKATNCDDETADEKNSDDYHKKCKRLSEGEMSMAVMKMQNSTEHKDNRDKIYQRRDTSKKSATNRIYIANLVKETNEHESGSLFNPPSSGLSQSQMTKEDNVVDSKTSTEPRATLVSAAIEGAVENDIQNKILHPKGCFPKNVEADISDTHKFHKKSDIITVSALTKEECETSPPNTRVRPIASCTQIEDNHDGTTLNVEFVDTLAKSVNNTECVGGKKVSGESCGVIDISPVDQNDKPAYNKSQQGCGQIEASITNPIEVLLKTELAASSTEKLQNAIALLSSRRQQVFSQVCSMKDTLARYEDLIERIRDGGDVGLASRCIESIISGNNHWMLNETVMQDNHNFNSQTEKRSSNRLSGIYVIGKSKCKDLEYICRANNWRLPIYYVEPSEGGKFRSNVVVHSKGFKLASEGDLESTPIEARESAAAQMIDKIHDYANAI